MSDDVHRVLLLDDHTFFRELLALRLAREPDLAVVAEASSLAEARQVLRQVEIDVALVDLNLPDGSGVDLIRDLRAANPAAPILLLTASGDRRSYAGAVTAGASGVLTSYPENSRAWRTLR